MSEKLSHTESNLHEQDIEQNSEAQPQSEEKIQDVKNETLDIEKSREQIREIHKPTAGSAQKSPSEDNTPSRSLLPSFESATETLAKTMGAIRRNLSPQDKRFSKVIHSPIVNSVSEATAKTLARPYAILSGGIVACAGSVLYIYYSRHLGYHYNFFVPVLLFFSGLVAGITVEILLKTFHHKQKRRS